MRRFYGAHDFRAQGFWLKVGSESCLHGLHPMVTHFPCCLHMDSSDGHYVTVDGKRALNLASANFLGLGSSKEAIVSERGVWGYRGGQGSPLQLSAARGLPSLHIT